MKNIIYHILFVSLYWLSPILTFSQENIGGMALDAESKQRIGKVLIINKTSGENTYNNSKGEFSLRLNPGDVIIASKDNYHSDTVTFSGAKAVIVNLKRKTIMIAPVTVMGRISPEEVLARRRQEYSKAYRLADPGDYVTVGQNGAGLSIDAVYNYFSKDGRNARRLTKYFEKEYEDNYIDVIFTKDIVREVTGLEGEPLENYMIRYRPTYNFVLTADRYQLIKYIKQKYEYFKHIPYIKPLPDLDKIDLNLEN